MKKLVLTIITILIIILSTGCKKTKTNPRLNPSLPETPTVETTIESTPIEEESSVAETTIEITEPPTTETEEITATTELIEETTESTTEIAPETVAAVPKYTFTELSGRSMYVVASVNVRSLPSTEGDIYFVYDMNDEVWVTGRCNETGWYRVDIEGHECFISDVYLSDNKIIPTTTQQIIQTTTQPRTQTTSGFIYYSISGVYPERAYEEYLYTQLCNRGIAWWYPYAVAQIWLESRWNPSATNGRDHGICQFKGESFSARAAYHANYPSADIWNPYDSLYVYSFYIRDVLAGVGWDVNAALAFYITGTFGMPHDSYVNHVLSLYNTLEAH